MFLATTALSEFWDKGQETLFLGPWCRREDFRPEWEALRGEVLPIGGLKEKLLAAHRGGIKLVLIPEENVKDLAEIPENIKNRLEIHPVKWIDEVLGLALERKPEALSSSDDVSVPPVEKKAEESVVTKH